MAWITLLEQIAGHERRERGREHSSRLPAASRLERYIADIPPDRYRSTAGADAMLRC